MSAELNIQLRLLLDGLQAQAKQAADIIKGQMGGSAGGGSAIEKSTKKAKDDSQAYYNWLKKAANEGERLAKSLTSGSWRYKQVMGKSVAGIVSGQEQDAHVQLMRKQMQGQQDTHVAMFRNEQKLQSEKDKNVRKAEAAITRQKQQAVAFNREMSSLAMPMFSPGSMWAKWVAARQTYTALSTSHGQEFLAGKQPGITGRLGGVLGRMSGGSATTAAGIAVAAATAVGVALIALKKAIIETIAAYEHARQIYAKSLMSGLGVQLTTKRGILSEIVGVSEEDILKFGAALNYLNPKIEWASKVLSQTNAPLTQVGWGFKIVAQDIKAIFAEIAAGIAPALLAFTDNLSSFLEVLGKSGFLKAAAEVINVILVGLNDVVGIVEIIINSFVVGFKIIGDAISIFIMEALNLLSKIPGLGKLGGWDTTKAKEDIVTQSQNLRDEIEKVFANFFGKKSTGMPSPQPFMKQLPTSSWEKMGLVIGGGRSTNDLIKESNKHLSVIAKAVSGTGYMPRPQQPSFGLNPAYANP